MAQEILYATGNAGKFAEIAEFVKRVHPSITLKQIDIDVDELQILDQYEVAVYKAQQAWNIVKKPLLIDDAGMFFDAYPLFPGTLTKQVVVTLGWEGLFKVSQGNDNMFHAMHLVYIERPDSLEAFKTSLHGKLIRPHKIDAPKGLSGYAYFRPDGSEKTLAEMFGTPEMEQYSYRVQAFKTFLAWYEKREKNGI